MEYFAYQFHITDECDQRCEHCYIFSEDNNKCLVEMKLEDARKEKVILMESGIKKMKKSGLQNCNYQL